MRATVFTYTAAMRAALVGNMADKAYTIWNEAVADPNCEPDCRLATTYIEVAARNGDTDKALKMYYKMRNAHRDSKLAPTVHAFTAAMRAASEGGRWEAALSIWDDMQRGGCKPTGHAFAAVISACSAGGNWKKAVALFDDMLALGIKPDVVSCTALISALGADGQWERCEKVVEWMMRNDIKPNVRTYTALVAALGSGRQWERALTVVKGMRAKALGPGIEANSYTYSALLKSLGEHGCWEQAEELFAELEREQLDLMKKEASMALNPSTPPLPQHSRSMSTTSSSSLASLSSFYSSGAPPPPQPSSSSSSHIMSIDGTAMSAFPGMSKTVPFHLPEGLTTWSSSLSMMAHETEEERKAAYGVVVSSAELVLGHAMASETEASYAELEQLQASSPRKSDNKKNNYNSSSKDSKNDEGNQNKERRESSADASASKAMPSSPGTPTTNNDIKKKSSSSGKEGGFSYFSSTSTHTDTTGTFGGEVDDSINTPDWAGGTAAMQGLHLDLPVTPHLQLSITGAAATAASKDATSTTIKPHLKPLPKGRGPVNEVVCGALMLAYERAGKWKEAVAVLDRAKLLGITANTIMINTALSALGKRGQNVAAQALFDTHSLPDAVSYETLVAAHGMAGDVVAAESAFKGMIKAGFVPRDYAYCGLIAAHGMAGDWKAAFKVAETMMDTEEEGGHDGGGAVGGEEEEGAKGSSSTSGGTIIVAFSRPRKTVHVYNALIAACDRAGQYERAIKLSQEMESDGVEPNNVTKQLLEGVCKEGVRAVEGQQAMAAALSAAVAAAGTVMMRVGMF